VLCSGGRQARDRSGCFVEEDPWQEVGRGALQKRQALGSHGFIPSCPSRCCGEGVPFLVGRGARRLLAFLQLPTSRKLTPMFASSRLKDDQCADGPVALGVADGAVGFGSSVRVWDAPPAPHPLQRSGQGYHMKSESKDAYTVLLQGARRELPLSGASRCQCSGRCLCACGRLLPRASSRAPLRRRHQQLQCVRRVPLDLPQSFCGHYRGVLAQDERWRWARRMHHKPGVQRTAAAARRVRHAWPRQGDNGMACAHVRASPRQARVMR